MHAYNFVHWHCTPTLSKTNEFPLVKLFANKLTVCNYQNMEYKIFKPKKLVMCVQGWGEKNLKISFQTIL